MKPLPPLLSVLALAAASLALPVQASAKAPAQPHDFNGDGRTDLVVNASQSVKSGEVGPGAVAVLYGKTNRKQVVSRYSAGVSSVADHGDGFGESTASADFDRDGKDELAVGAPYAGARYSGQVAVLPGHRSGLSTEGIQVFSQKSRGLKGTPERGDHFGWAVRLLDLSGDRRPELVIGSPGEDKGTGRFYLLANEKKITPLGTRRYRSKDFGLGGRRFGLAFLP